MQTTIPQITNKRLCLISLGCPKNLVDSEKILGILGTNGYVITAQPQDADYILINTCAFIQPAVKESLDMINNMKKIKEKTGGKIIVFGCLSRKNGDILFMDKDIDAVVGPDGMYKLPDILQSLQSDKRVFSSPHSLNYPLKNSPRLVLTYPYAYLKITEGCSNFCSYCLIPKLRGPLKSFPENEIIKRQKNCQMRG